MIKLSYSLSVTSFRESATEASVLGEKDVVCVYMLKEHNCM